LIGSSKSRTPHSDSISRGLASSSEIVGQKCVPIKNLQLLPEVEVIEFRELSFVESETSSVSGRKHISLQGTYLKLLTSGVVKIAQGYNVRKQSFSNPLPLMGKINKNCSYLSLKNYFSKVIF